jgi:hypothetical protein
MSMILAALALQVAVPQPGELRTFQDWAVGCDNSRACQATSLAPDGAEAWQTLSIRRGAEGSAEPALSFTGMGEEDLCGAAFVVDDARLPARLIRAASCTTVHPADVAALLTALRAGRELRMVGANGTDLGAVSLAGLSASLLYFDEAQRRLDTQTALVRRGPRPASAVPAPPALPEVRLPARPTEFGPEVDAARIAALRREAGCTLDEVGGPDEVSQSPLEPGKGLILLACGSGAYNVTWIPYVATRSPNGRINLALARFDHPTGGIAEEGSRPELTNAQWIPGERLLREVPLGRGLGDCGSRSAYAWDGTRFRLVEQSEMAECRGALDYITTWRARVLP